MLSKGHDYLWCLVKKKNKKYPWSYKIVWHTVSSNERNQLAMEKEKGKRKCIIKFTREKYKGRVRLIFF